MTPEGSFEMFLEWVWATEAFKGLRCFQGEHRQISISPEAKMERQKALLFPSGRLLL
jgi:hypothetical protein